MYEHKHQQLLPLREFFSRMYCHAMLAIIFTLVALGIGMIGYHGLEGFSWIDSFLNASMILGGMGEIDILKTEAGKVFAGCYAMFSGLWVVASMGVLLAPVFHRIVHHMHVGDDEEKEKPTRPKKPSSRN